MWWKHLPSATHHLPPNLWHWKNLTTQFLQVVIPTIKIFSMLQNHAVRYSTWQNKIWAIEVAALVDFIYPVYLFDMPRNSYHWRFWVVCRVPCYTGKHYYLPLCTDWTVVTSLPLAPWRLPAPLNQNAPPLLTLCTSLKPPFPSRHNNRYRSLRMGWSLNLQHIIMSSQSSPRVPQATYSVSRKKKTTSRP